MNLKTEWLNQKWLLKIQIKSFNMCQSLCCFTNHLFFWSIYHAIYLVYFRSTDFAILLDSLRLVIRHFLLRNPFGFLEHIAGVDTMSFACSIKCHEQEDSPLHVMIFGWSFYWQRRIWPSSMTLIDPSHHLLFCSCSFQRVSL